VLTFGQEEEIEEITQLIKIMLNSMCINVNGEKE